MAKKRFHGYYEGYKQTRRQERMDAAMIGEDMNAVGCLPQDVVYKQYPKMDAFDDYNLNDNIKGIDKQISDDASQARRNKNGQYPEKY